MVIGEFFIGKIALMVKMLSVKYLWVKRPDVSKRCPVLKTGQNVLLSNHECSMIRSIRSFGEYFFKILIYFYSMNLSNDVDEFGFGVNEEQHLNEPFAHFDRE